MYVALESKLPKTSFWEFELGYNSLTDVLEFSIQFISTSRYPLLDYYLSNAKESVLLVFDEWKIQENFISTGEYHYYHGGRIRNSDIPSLVRILRSPHVCIGTTIRQQLAVNENVGYSSYSYETVNEIVDSEKCRFLNYIRLALATRYPEAIT